MIVPRPYQSEAVEAVYEHLRTKDNNPCVVLPTGCHAKDHPILMYDGTVRKVQDISVGDIIMGADSTPRHVLALARGREPMARITPIKGEPFVVNMNHILSLVSTNEGKGDFTCYQKGGEITNITVREYLTKSKSWRHLRKLYRVPVNFSIPKNLPIPPHILGLLLGDGIMTNAIGLTSAEEELGDEFSRYAESIGCSVRVTENDRNVPTYYAVVAKGAKNPLFEILHQLGLRGHCAHNKFIPKEYLTASRSDRLQLLAGLLDSDGFFDGHCLEITTQSRELAGDIVFLARSLGFMANCHEKYCACQTGAGGWYYRVHISGDLSPIPCRRKRHVFHVRQQKKNVLRTGFSVEILSEDDFYGFELDGDHLYVDGNFVVHHNTGKSLVLAQIAKDSVEKWNGRVLILAHVKELLEQNADKIRKLCPELKIGIYSAGLRSRDTTEQVIVAGIQSVYNKACELDAFDLVVVDEAHAISSEGDGMYRTFLADMKIINPHVRVIGLTATPFRLKGGLICKPENILNEICYEAGLKEMIQQGYLSPLISRAGRAEANLANLHIRGGEFISDEVAAAMDNEALVTSACREIVELTRDRKSVLIFTASVDHCKHVAEKIQAFSGKECAIVTGDTSPAERAEIIARFKGEFIPADLFGTPKPPLKFLANVNVLTTGFDAPNTDCVVMLRPTNSPGLLIQCAGRGTRLSPETGKSSCLFLDYGGNILRHGPLDMIKVKEPGSGKGGDAPAKKCPQCLALIHAGYTACPECGYVFPPKENNDKMTQTASSAGVISGQVDYTDYEVLDVYYCVHEKRGADPDAPKTMRVDYQVGFNEFKSEWVCPEHTGYARGKFEKWWHERAALGCPMPRSAREAVSLANEGLLAAPESITVKTIAGERFERVTGFRLKERPVMREPGEDLEPGETWTSPAPPDDLEDDIPF
ncbi:DEAD/DEAH box helicase [Victivallaceae bacterium BBE-744-WT-12]|uniref:DEAD/DEAH box helicase n=1 Tax=Victivallis lenta TaxID=2606640 RepID=A0A844G6C7_9BACT|nr:DEAD/DEAH box helicase family protein [Victivallis lenta]MST99387.1 DEAD/DEAH box helicase [Victivallis lenta]